jgi:hypothetical protein
VHYLIGFACCKLCGRSSEGSPIWQSMNLARHSISSTRPVHVLDAAFDPDAKIFAAATEQGFAVYRTYPLELVRKRGMSPRHPLVRPLLISRRALKRHAVTRPPPAYYQPTFPRRRGSESSLSTQQGRRLGRCPRKGGRGARIQEPSARAGMPEGVAGCSSTPEGGCF